MRLTGMGAAVFAATVLAACAHHPDVRPGADGIHRVIVRDAEEERAERNALSQARSYCKQSEQTPAIIDESTTYEGSMDEDTRKTVRNASKAAGVVGGSMSVLGGRSERNAGNVVGGAGVVGSIMTGDDAYVTQMSFKCE